MAKTYRVTVCDVTAPLAPVCHVAYISAAKYDGAWKGARGALDADKRNKPVAGYPGEHCKLYADEACGEQFKLSGDAFTVARIDDMTTRNVKLDAKALREALIVKEGETAEDVVKRLTAQLATK